MKVLIAYYSRTGVTRAAAEAIAAAMRQKEGLEVQSEEVVDTKPRKGALGYLAAGKDAMLKRQTVIAPVSANPADFDLLVAGTPVWAFTLATPVRTYLLVHGKSAKRVAFFCTMGGSGDKKTFKDAEAVCARVPVATMALLERHVKERNPEEFLAKVADFADRLVAAGQAEAASPPDGS